MRQLNKTSTAAFATLALIAVLGCNSASPTAPQSLQITPSNASVTGGRSVVLTVSGGDGEEIVAGVVWRSSNPLIASIDGGGRVTGGYGEGQATITATARGASGSALVDLVRVCADLAPINGEPDSSKQTQTFDVEFEPGTSVQARADELAGVYGFILIRVDTDGFSALLTPTQAVGVGCSPDVASMTYL